MAEDKNKVIWYTNWGTTFLKLTDEEAGKLIKQFAGYVLDQNPEPPDRLTELMFDPIKDTLKRDLIKYNTKKGINQKNGKKGGRPKKTQINPEKANGLIHNPEKGVNVNDKVSVSVNDNTSLKEKIEKYLIESFTWKKAVIRNFDALGVKLDTEQLNELIILFCNELEMVDDLHKADRDNKAHCSRWIKKYLKDGQRQQQNETTTKKSRYEKVLEHNMETARQLAADKERNS